MCASSVVLTIYAKISHPGPAAGIPLCRVGIVQPDHTEFSARTWWKIPGKAVGFALPKVRVTFRALRLTTSTKTSIEFFRQMRPCPRGACGRTEHGRPATPCGDTDETTLACSACDRPGAREDGHYYSRRWKHVGDGPYWSGLGDWAAQVGEGWVHKLDVEKEPFDVGESVCCRLDCVFNLYVLPSQEEGC